MALIGRPAADPQPVLQEDIVEWQVVQEEAGEVVVKRRGSSSACCLVIKRAIGLDDVGNMLDDPMLVQGVGFCLFDFFPPKKPRNR